MSEATVRALVAVTNTPPGNNEPLYETVNPEALDALFRGRADGRVTFEHSGYQIFVHSGGEIRLEKAGE